MESSNRGSGYGGGSRHGELYVSSKFGDDDMFAVKIKGCPFRARPDEIMDFFKDHNPIEKSVYCQHNADDGRRTGLACILFENEDDANAALALDGEYIGPRYVKLEVMSYGDYSKFVPDPNAQTDDNAVLLHKYVNEGNKDRSLVMKGCPWKITSDEIIEFFDGFGTITDADVTIEERDGRRTGSALVVFENEEKAQDAKDQKQKQNIGTPSRYVDLFDSGDSFFQRVCRIKSDY